MVINTSISALKLIQGLAVISDRGLGLMRLIRGLLGGPGDLVTTYNGILRLTTYNGIISLLIIEVTPMSPFRGIISRVIIPVICSY